MLLALVYLAMGLHWAHWKINGTSLAPLELNEVMHTLELGVVTAGFLFMAVATVSVLIFGRFFCSWGCHILALEDASAWLLQKLRIRPKLFRSRALLLVPLGAMTYMFLWPQCKRLLLWAWPESATLLGDLPAFEWRVLAQGEGWASFITSDYARNLPGPAVAVFTFVVVGGVMIYMLGTRAFCRLACPYGAIFAAADRVAPGRIVLAGPCTGCGHCTAACDSHVRVHEETAAFGKVVDAGCLKDLDCVAACPQGSLRFGFSTPALFSKALAPTPQKRFDLSWAEDSAAAITFVLSLLVLRGLYGVVPFLLALALAGMCAVAVVVLWRLARRQRVEFGKRTLKNGHLTGRGRVATACMAGFLLLVVHSGFVRWHEWRGTLAAERISLAHKAGATIPEAEFDCALMHLGRQARLALAGADHADEKIVAVAAAARRPAAAIEALQRMSARAPQRADILRALADALATDGQLAAALSTMTRAVSVEPSFESFHDLGCLQAATQDYAAAAASLRAALRCRDDAEARAKLDQLLAILRQG